jgi:hypothetical protein
MTIKESNSIQFAGAARRSVPLFAILLYFGMGFLLGYVYAR